MVKKTDSPAADNSPGSEQGKHTLIKRTQIKKDTYLHCWCPNCGKGLNEDGKAVFQIVNRRGEVGISRVSPYLNVLDRESTIQVEDDEELADVQCPHCQASFIVPDRRCEKDDCKVMAFHVSVSDSIKLNLIVCVRRTCRWFTMSDEDNERLILRDSHEW